MQTLKQKLTNEEQRRKTKVITILGKHSISSRKCDFFKLDQGESDSLLPHKYKQNQLFLKINLAILVNMKCQDEVFRCQVQSLTAKLFKVLNICGRDWNEFMFGGTIQNYRELRGLKGKHQRIASELLLFKIWNR